MMFQTFEGTYRRDPVDTAGPTSNAVSSGHSSLQELIEEFGGASFNGGLYRIIRAEDLGGWNERVTLAFPSFKGRIACFGYDWSGRVFAADAGRPVEGQAGVVMFEPGGGEALNVPANIESFHNKELVEFSEAALAVSFYLQWLASGRQAPNQTQCVGYRVPLFLGGADELDNLELSDLDVYWHLLGQLIVQARGLPVGTPIRIKRT